MFAEFKKDNNISPPGATHKDEAFTGVITWYREVKLDYYNSFSDSWEPRIIMEYWDIDKWVPTGLDWRSTKTTVKL